MTLEEDRLGRSAIPKQSAGWLDAGWPLFALLTLFLLGTIAQSQLKLVWGDELFTLYLAHTGSCASIWQALRAGADPNPPLIHTAVLLSTRLFGVSGLAMRLPSIFFVGVALASMWSILRSWVSPGFASVGLLAFMATRGFDYSYDARSYAPMMCFAMLSLALWFAASAHTGLNHTVLLAAMSFALAAGLFSNYYCVLAFFPIAAGQLVADLHARRISLPVWTALLVSALPLLLLLPLIRHNISEFSPHAWNRPHLSMISLSYLELVEGVLWPVLAFAAVAVFRRTDGLRLSPSAASAFGVLLLYPFLGYAVAVCGAGMISPRCVAPVCCGVGLLAGIAAERVLATRRGGLRAVLAVLVLWVVAREGFCASLLLQQRRAFFVLRDRAAQVDGDQPMLVADSSLVLPLYFYSAPQVARRIIFPIDFAAIHRLESDDSGEQNLWAGRYGVFPFPIVPFAQIASVPRAVIVARPDGWLAQALEQRGAHLQPTAPEPSWDAVGGVFTPMAHRETRFLLLTR